MFPGYHIDVNGIDVTSVASTEALDLFPQNILHYLTSLPVNRQGDNTGTASPSYSKETPLKWDRAKPTSSSWFTPVQETRQIDATSDRRHVTPETVGIHS